MKNIHSIFLIATTFTLLSTVVGLKCYQCSTVNDTGCETISKKSNESSMFLQECTGNYHGNVPFCRKVKQIITDEYRHVRIRRSCGWVVDESADPCYNIENDFHQEVICVCHEDGCNSSPYNALLHPALMFGTFLAICFK